MRLRRGERRETPGDHAVDDPTADLVSFYPPEHPTQAQQVLVARIVSLDHRSVHIFRPGTHERQEIKLLLGNSTSTLADGMDYSAELLYGRAEAAFYHYVQVRNRIRYLLGMVIGVVIIAAVGVAAFWAPGLPPFMSPRLLVMLLLFAGMGSIVSVLTRLSSLDLKQETSTGIVVISGAARPVVAMVFAVIVYLLFDTGIVDLHVGGTSPNGADEIYLITSFLCGFSERFATDILAQVPFGKAEGVQEKAAAGASEPGAVGGVT